MSSLMMAIEAAVGGEPAGADAPAAIGPDADQLYAARIAGRVEGANAERQRIAAILTAPAAQGMPDFAAQIAFGTDVSPADAVKVMERQAATAAPAAVVGSIDVARVYADRKAQISGITPPPEPEASGSGLDPAAIYARRARQARGGA